MIKTKLILVDGIPGSGKSTISQFISKQMDRNKIKVKWYFEHDMFHPITIDYKELEKQQGETEPDHSRRIMEKYKAAWDNFVNKIESDDTVYLIESYLFQNAVLFPHFLNDLNRLTIKKYYHKILEILSPLNPVLILFHHDNIQKVVNTNWKLRGERWNHFVANMFENSVYCKNRNLKGADGSIVLLRDFNEFMSELYEEFNFRKIRIDSTYRDWSDYRRRILKFFKLEEIEDKTFKCDLNRFCGEYFKYGFIFRIHKKNNQLYLDEFYPNMKLLPVANNVFEIEGFPITIKFYKYKGIRKLKFIKSLCWYPEQEIVEEYTPYEISKKELTGFCGDYYCESKKLSRKIYQKDGRLFYKREESYESLLIPVTKTRLIVSNNSGNYLDFQKIDKKWQFTFEVNGNNSLSSIFVLKE